MGRPCPSTEARILELFDAKNVLRPRDLLAAGLPTAPLTNLVRQGILVRSGRGLYSLPDCDVSEVHSLVQASVRVPAGIVCLLSALAFHRIGSQLPHRVWLAIHPKARLPRFEFPPAQFVRFSGPALELAVEDHVVEGVCLKVYSPAKTVVDCFRYRNKLGLDVAIEALQDYLREGGSVDEVWKIAKACRMARVMQPYLEAALAIMFG